MLKREPNVVRWDTSIYRYIEIYRKRKNRKAGPTERNVFRAHKIMRLCFQEPKDIEVCIHQAPGSNSNIYLYIYINNNIYSYTSISETTALIFRNTMLHIRSWKYRTIFSEMRYICLSLVSFSLWEERSIYSLYVSLLYIERLNHSLCGSIDARA